MLARAVGPQVEKDIKALLDQMFSVGLSVELTSALRVIAQEVPQLQRDIQGEILVWVHMNGCHIFSWHPLDTLYQIMENSFQFSTKGCHLYMVVELHGHLEY